jgi:hypothetical protein
LNNSEDYVSGPPEPVEPASRPIERSTGPSRPATRAETALALGWIAVPAAQYWATSERTRFQLGEVEGEAEPPAWVEWDLTPAYLALIVLTAVYAGLRFVRARRTGSSSRSADTIPGGLA